MNKKINRLKITEKIDDSDIYRDSFYYVSDSDKKNKINGNYNNEYYLYKDTGPLTNINQITKVTKKK